MPEPRIHLPVSLTVGQTVELDENARRHVAQVLRLRVGDRVVLFNGEGGEYPATIVHTGKRSVQVRIDDFAAIDRESPLRVHLGLGISKGERMDFALQKATELGVARITPLFTERVVVRLDDRRLGKRHDHWRGVIAAACEQSGRNRLPVLHDALALDDWLAARDEASRLFLDPRAEHSLKDLPAPGADVALAIGPEGGFSARERDRIRQRQFTGVELGPRVLRTETAAMAALAAVQLLWGDMG